MNASSRNANKKSLWEIVVERGYAQDKAGVEKLVLAGAIKIDGAKIKSLGLKVAQDCCLEVLSKAKPASRAGQKLEAALKTFNIDIAGRCCADVGAGSGGFTEVLISHGAQRVYAIDVGYGDIAWQVRNDPRVVLLERTNARHLEKLAEPISFACVDVSFISLRLILPRVRQWFEDGVGYEIVTLVKPQFEAQANQVGQGGVIRDRSVHQAVLEGLLSWLADGDFKVSGLIPSPLRGKQGNLEFLLWLNDQTESPLSMPILIKQALDQAVP